MPQNANAVYPAVNSGVSKPLQVDSSGALIVANNDEAESSALNLTAATVVKASSGYVSRIVVLVAGSAVGSVNDAATTGAAATANQIFAIPNTVGAYQISFPVSNGIVVTPGTGQTVAVTYR